MNALSSPSKRLLALVAVAALYAGASTLRLRATRHYFAAQRPEDVYYLPPPAWLRVLDVGYHEALADVLWTRALVYSGTGLGERIRLHYVLAYARAITELDPHWERPYLWAPTATVFQTRPASDAEVEDAAAYVLEGTRRFPSSGELAWKAGAFYAYELALRYRRGTPERVRAEAIGQDLLMRAARRGAGPAWLALTNASRLLQLGERELAVQHLEEMYALTTDPDTRDEIGRRIAALRSEATREAIERTLRAIDEAHRREYPYLPLGLYLLVAPRIEPLDAPLESQ